MPTTTSSFSLNLIPLLQNCSTFSQLKQIHASILTNYNHNNNSFLITQLLKSCFSFKKSNYAFLIFTQIKNPNPFLWNIMIRGLSNSHSPQKSILLYVDMRRSRVPATTHTFPPVINACSSQPRLGEEVHGHVWKLGFDSEVVIQTSLICCYSDLGITESARQVFDEMSSKDLIAWTAILRAYARNSDLVSAKGVFDSMPEKSVFVWNTMITAYVRAGNVSGAKELFESMDVERDVVSWTTMVSCYAKNGRFKEAVSTYGDMQVVGICPDEFTLSTVISACAHVGELGVGVGIHRYLLRHTCIGVDAFIGSALIDMYAKCGSIESALLVFFKLRDKNLFCWNSLIEGLAMHGFSNEALAIFREMEVEKKVWPNHVTFVGVLCACSHGGLVNEGRGIYASMIGEYGIVPMIEHYGCMVDLLSRAGFLEEAMALIDSNENGTEFGDMGIFIRWL